MAIHLLREPATSEQLAQMLADLDAFIKVVVDIQQGVMTGGGEMHADGEQLLLEQGSQQEDLWGANYYPETREIRFEALINIRPRQGNRAMTLQDRDLRSRTEAVIRRLLEPGP